MPMNFVTGEILPAEREIVEDFVRLINGLRRQICDQHDCVRIGLDSKNGGVWQPPCFKQAVPEIATFLRLLKSKNCKRGLEIGLYHSGTHYFFRRIVEEMYSIEIEFGFISFGLQVLEKAGYNSGSTLIHADSSSLLTGGRVGEVLGGELCDFLFIDGNHSYNACKNDYLCYEKFVRPGGIIAFHDFFAAGGVNKLVLELAEDRDITCIETPVGRKLGIAYFEK